MLVLETHWRFWYMTTRIDRRGQLVALLATALENRAIPGDFATMYEDDIAFGWEAMNGGWTVRTYEPSPYEVHLAVRVDDATEFQKVIRATTATVDWTPLGEGYIVYPKGDA